MESSKRLCYFDNLKTMMIIFVVVMHAAVTYSGSGRWYYNESSIFGDSSFYIFSFYQTFTQAYFMSLLFMVGGFFLVPSLEKKGRKTFVLDRLYRLGIPTIIYIFFLHPLCVALVNADVRAKFFSYYWHGITTLEFFSWTGPLWFAEILLGFSLAYVLVQKGYDRFLSKNSLSLSTKNISLLILFIATFASVLRHFFPLGSSIMNLQLGYFSAYVVMFLMGIAAYRKKLIQQMNYQLAKRYLLVSLVIGVLPWVYMIYGGERDIPALKIEPWSFIFALWESSVCVTAILGLIGIFKEMFNTQNSWQKFLSANAFAVYCFHAPVLIGISVLLKDLIMPAILKFGIVSITAIIASFLVSWLIRRFDLFRKVFS